MSFEGAAEFGNSSKLPQVAVTSTMDQVTARFQIGKAESCYSAL
jgi:hypothetical protein